MLTFAFDRLTRDADGTRVEIRPNCPWPGGDAPIEQQRADCVTMGTLCMVSPGGLTCERTDVLLRIGAPFVYPLELRYNLRESFAANQALAPGVPAAVLEQARAGRAVILVWIAHEQTPLELDGAAKAWVFDVIQNFVVAHDLPPRQVWFVSGNVSGVQSFTQWLRARRLYEAHAFRFRTLAMSPGSVQRHYQANAQGRAFTLERLAGNEQSFVMRLVPMSRDDFAEHYVEPAEIAEEQRSNRLRPKRFLSMNWRPRFHRQLVVTYLAGRGLIDGSLVSFPAADLDLNNGCAFPERTDFLRAAWRRLQPRLPLTVDVPPDSIDHHAVLAGWPYRQSYFNLVSETEVGADCAPFSTEKVLKPMLNYQPFIVVSTARTLRYLCGIGFKGFPELIDERYDQVDDPVARLVRILDEIDRLGQLSQAEARDRYFACLPTLEHNRAHLIDGRHELDDLFDDLEAQLG
ncbi:MAG: hypothetical protein HY060_10680 [Proteobacteria bacterium]|nr:hypothetical protein [Pseudomonadota bacterium]